MTRSENIFSGTLEAYEDAIQSPGYIERGRAFYHIKAKRLYPDDSFAAYSARRWKIAPQSADRLIRAMKAAMQIRDAGGEIPRMDQALALSKLPSSRRATVWAQTRALYPVPSPAKIARVAAMMKEEEILCRVPLSVYEWVSGQGMTVGEMLERVRRLV
jgi:hypothetical protein